jgi:ankyrin repeat protein
MNTQITAYNSFETTSPIDLWQLRTYLSAEIIQCPKKAISFDFLSEDNRYLKANIETLLSIELKGWDMHVPPSSDERKKFIMDLFGYGFPVHIIYGVQQSLLKQAVDQDDRDMFEFLLSCCEINSASNIDCEFLLEHMLDNHSATQYIDVFFAFIHLHQINIHINKKNKDGYTPLMRSVLNHDIKLVEHLITAGASLEEVTVNGETALLLAAKLEYLDLFKRLVERGANIKATANNRANVCSFAYMQNNHGNADLLNYLIEYHFDRVFDDLDGVPILIHAIENGYDINTMKLLITPERVNQPCPETGNTPLIMVYENNDCDREFNEFTDELIELLLKAGANPAMKNKQNQTAITMVKLKYNEQGHYDRQAGKYDEDLEDQINNLVFKSHEIYTTQDILLEDKAENYNAKLKLKSQALHVLKEIRYATEENLNKVKLGRSKLQFEIANLYRDRFMFNMDDDLEVVIIQFEKLTRDCMENYKHAQFEIASLLIFVAGREQKDGVEYRAMLIRALKHADNAQDNALSNFIIGDLSGKVITDTSMPLPANSYERINYFAGEIQSQAQKILALEKQLAALKQPTSRAASLSGLIRKRSDSPVFSVLDSEDSCSSSKKLCLSDSKC